ncbi:unnamed protein product [Protopolystoma xenopodis]|uniref:Uncharacterized protein n=1 Tax=Protopolystoma xenopodis TaxID=117903 RepID=A0A3S5BP90_9PLAT|nr:unnamed protein product [Protopolystoma xenopodis]
MRFVPPAGAKPVRPGRVRPTWRPPLRVGNSMAHEATSTGPSDCELLEFTSFYRNVRRWILLSLGQSPLRPT